VVDAHGKVIGQVKPIAGGAPGRFAGPTKLLDHYARHGADFGATSAVQYEQAADAFLNGPRGAGVLEKVRTNGDIVRYDPATQAFGVVKPDGTIRTYYKPDPAVHGYSTNLDYFNAQ
jgi:filamentous hemagglutinin